MTLLRRRLLATAGLFVVLGMGAAAAADTVTNKTKLKFKDGDTVETISFEGQLSPGQSISLYSEAGTPVTVTRTDAGLKVALPNKTHEVPYADPSELGADGERRNVVIIKHDGVHEGDVDIDAEVLVDDPAIQAEIDAAMAEAGANGEHKKIIIKHIEKKEVSTEDATAN
ncbi:hypothetical protein C7S18_22915 [Ahniella affigens]|uniref:Uncharacterized protein n=2 Tax=Ahniella affigens TaxID=2021234 RepID=A0A2P1PYD3_9GAMM|nr:hypothetical protein C7S18_22915 [Ahniella affigens]